MYLCVGDYIIQAAKQISLAQHARLMATITWLSLTTNPV